MGDHRPIRMGETTAMPAVVLCVAVAVLDLSLARSALFSPLLVLGPLVAALRSGPAATILVSALAIVRSVLLGTVDESVGSVDHTVALVLVGVVGLLATAAAAVRERSARLTSDLAGAERRLDAILANLGEAVIVRAADGSIVFANQAAAELSGVLTPEELMASTTDELQARFLHLDEAGAPLEPAQAATARALAGEEPEPLLVHRIERATGRDQWLLQKATPVRDASGRVTLAVSAIEDVTAIRRAERHQRFLAAAGKLVSSSLDVGATLEKTAWALVPDVADWAIVDVPDEHGGLRSAAIAHIDAEKRDLLAGMREAFPPHGTDERSPAAVLRHGRPTLVPRVAEEDMARYAVDERHLAFMRRLGIRSVAIVPMLAGERVLGTISLATAESERVLGEDELILAAELGVRAGIAVENARVHAERSYIATTLQRSLLPPRLPEVPGLKVAARFRAAGESTEVGGDFYDLFEVDGGWMAVIGDVTGKGPTAAALTSLARYTMRTAAVYERAPGAVLEHLNSVLVTEPDRRRLCTAAMVRVEACDDDADGAMRIAVACGGHPPPLLLCPGEPARPAGAAGTLLGAFPEGRWPVTESILREGDSLVLYTDGVTDARGEDGRFGSERLAAVLGAAAECDADAIAGRLDAALLDYEVGAQRDDVALLVLRAVDTGVGAVAPDVMAGPPAQRRR